MTRKAVPVPESQLVALGKLRQTTYPTFAGIYVEKLFALG
jgi:hypothetical protein